MASIKEWLAAIQCEQYADTFIENGYDDVSVIKDLTEDELVSMGVKKGHAKKIIKTAQAQDGYKPTT
jgi:hypothetical protein